MKTTSAYHAGLCLSGTLALSQLDNLLEVLFEGGEAGGVGLAVWQHERVLALASVRKARGDLPRRHLHHLARDLFIPRELSSFRLERRLVRGEERSAALRATGGLRGEAQGQQASMHEHAAASWGQIHLCGYLLPFAYGLLPIGYILA